MLTNKLYHLTFANTLTSNMQQKISLKLFLLKLLMNPLSKNYIASSTQKNRLQSAVIKFSKNLLMPGAKRFL